MRVLMIRSQSNPEIIDVNHDLLAFQHLVGGMIEVVEPFQDDDVVLVCNETGRCIGRPVNRVVNNNIDICGDFFLCGQKDDQLCDFPMEKVFYYNALFRLPS